MKKTERRPQAHYQTYKEAFSKHNWDFRTPVAITLATNASNQRWTRHGLIPKVRALHRSVDLLDKAVSMDLLGRFYWDEKRRRRRIVGWLVVENENSNIHVHGLIDIGNHDLKKVRRLFEAHWKKLYPSGSVKLEKASSPNGWQSYTCKKADSVKLLGDLSIILIPRR